MGETNIAPHLAVLTVLSFAVGASTVFGVPFEIAAKVSVWGFMAGSVLIVAYGLWVSRSREGGVNA